MKAMRNLKDSANMGYAMSKVTERAQRSFRLTQRTIDEIDRLHAELIVRQGGVTVSKNSFFEILLREGAEAVKEKMNQEKDDRQLDIFSFAKGDKG